MSRALLDTDIFSEVLKGRGPIVARAGADYLARHGEFTVSVVSAMEIVYGLHRADRTKQLEEFESTLASTRFAAQTSAEPPL
jgi:predicted nucleic acid-binding protein